MEKIEKTSLGIRTCGIFIVTKDGRLLLAHPTMSKDLTIPKGQMEKGETPWETAVRETLEETGVDVRKIRILSSKAFEPLTYVNRRKTLYAFMVITDAKLDVNDMECTTFVTDKDGKRLRPENDKFYLVHLNDSTYEKRLHDTQRKILESVREEYLKFLKS